MSGPDETSERRSSPRGSRSQFFVPTLLGVLAVLAAGVLLVAAVLDDEPAPVARPTVTPAPSPSPTPAGPCDDQATGAFKPTRLTVPGVVKNAEVIALPRDADNIPSVPPVNAKHVVAWDRPPGIKPGSNRGNVLLNTHTWPDGSALGNAFLDELDEGDLMIVKGKDTRACYEVSKRIEVLDSEGYPPYYDREGPPQLALIVCSGRRLGPGHWTHRTIWFAVPVSDAATA